MLWILVAVGCARVADVEIGDTDTEPIDTAADDTGTDSESATDTEETGDTGEPDTCPPHETPAPGAAGLGDCLTGELVAGRPIQGTTRGGLAEWDAERYGAVYCGGLTTADYSAPERVYSLVIAGTQTVTLTPECGALSLRLVRHMQGADPCGEFGNLASCETDVADLGGVQSVTVHHPNDPGHYLVIVDGMDGYEGNFTLSVQ